MLHDVDLHLSPGLTGLLGPNGAGKTTLLRTLATVVPPRGGSLELDGLDATRPAMLSRIRRHLGYLPQGFGFPPRFTVAEFVSYSAWLRGMERTAIRPAAMEAIESVGLRDSARTQMRRLSHGMRQRAGIAATVIGRPRIILLDEPTVGLDPMQRIEFRKLIQVTAVEFDACVLLSTHLVEDIGACCEQVSVLESGRSVFSGSVADFAELARPDAPGTSDLERSYATLLETQRGGQ